MSNDFDIIFSSSIDDESEIAVAIGEQNYCKHSKRPRPEKTLYVRRVISRDFSMESLNNDIALLELVDRVQFSKAVQPICLPTGLGAYAVLTGQGKTMY